MSTPIERARAALATACTAILALALAGCAPLHGPAAAPPAVSAAPGHEPAFLSHVAVNNLYELELSRLTVSRTADPRVRSLARRLAAHEARNRRQLAALMRARGLSAPTRLPADKAGKLRQLQALPPGPQLDAAYVRVVGVEDGQSAIALLERARRESHDAALLAWIDRALPVVREDLQAAQQLAGRIAG